MALPFSAIILASCRDTSRTDIIESNKTLPSGSFLVFQCLPHHYVLYFLKKFSTTCIMSFQLKLLYKSRTIKIAAIFDTPWYKEIERHKKKTELLPDLNSIWESLECYLWRSISHLLHLFSVLFQIIIKHIDFLFNWFPPWIHLQKMNYYLLHLGMAKRN